MRLAIISIAIALAATNGVAQSPGVRAADLTDIAAANDRLFRGIRSSDVGAVKVALEQHADVNARSVEGDTPLMFAAVLSTAECLKVLLDGGADPNARDKRGGTALMRAVPNIEKSGCCWIVAPKSMLGRISASRR